MRVRLRALLLLLLPLLAACGSNSNDREPTRTVSNGPASGREWFTDRAEQTGLDFLHFNGMSGEYYSPEILAPGVALFDSDNDGDLDVFIVQGRMLGQAAARSGIVPAARRCAPGRLFRNDLQVNPDGTRRFDLPT